jgi:hypothetical protein
VQLSEANVLLSKVLNVYHWAWDHIPRTWIFVDKASVTSENKMKYLNMSYAKSAELMNNGAGAERS